MDLAFFGHHKCASTSTEALCFDLCNKLGYTPIYKKTAFVSDLSPFLKKEGLNFIISINSSYKSLDGNHDFKGFHIIRDPRDICISGYFSHLHTHKIEGFDRLGSHREKLQQLNFDDGLIHEIEFTSFWLEHIENWNYEDSRILEVKMEDMIVNPRKTWMQIFRWLGILNVHASPHPIDNVLFKSNHLSRLLGIPAVFMRDGIPEKTLELLSDKYSFKSLSKGREIGQEDVKSHYRKGKSGDWKNYFKEEHKNYFKQKYGNLLIKLGYEKDLNW